MNTPSTKGSNRQCRPSSGDGDPAAVRYAKAHPGYVFTVLGNNFLRLFDLTNLAFAQAAAYGEYGYGSSWGDVEYFSTWAILLLAAVALLRGAVRRWPVGVWLAPLLLLLITLATRANPRFRAPFDPYLVLIAAATFTARPVRTAREDLNPAAGPSTVPPTVGLPGAA